MNQIRKLFKFLGPGFITGAADDDPSAIGTYSQTGAQFGYGQLWTALFSLPFLTSIQEMAGRIGMVTGKGLARIIKEHYPRGLLYLAVFLLTIGNTIFIGADLAAMASSAKLLIDLPFAFWIFAFAILTLFLEIISAYRTYSQFLKYLALSLSTYIFASFAVHQDWTEIMHCAFVPKMTLSREFFLNIAAILGTRASPYLFFWQPSQEVEEEIEQLKISDLGGGQPEISRVDIRRMRWNTAVGMLFSGVIMFFIIITTASTLGIQGLASIETADQAAEALRPFAGGFAFLLFATGIISTGLLVIPVLAGSAAYALSETFGWEAGLSKKFHQARGFYGIMSAAVAGGLLINLTSVKPFRMLYYAGVVNGIIVPVLMVLVMLIANSRKIMGERVNSPLSNITGYIMAGASVLAAIGLIASLFS